MSSSSSICCPGCDYSLEEKSRMLEGERIIKTIFYQNKVCDDILNKLFQEGLQISTIPYLTVETLLEFGIPKLSALKLLKELNDVSELLKSKRADSLSVYTKEILEISYNDLCYDFGAPPTDLLAAEESDHLRVTMFSHTWAPRLSNSLEHHYISLTLHNTCRDSELVIKGIKIEVISSSPYKEPDEHVRGPESLPSSVSHYCRFLTGNTEYLVLYSDDQKDAKHRVITARKKTNISFGFQADKPSCYQIFFTVFFGPGSSVSTTTNYFVQSKSSNTLFFS